MKANSFLPDVTDEQNLFPISTVAESTGVPTVTLRAWERRYDFLKPHRTVKGHRLYSMEQIALVRRVTALIESGIPVGRVGDLIRQERLIAAQPVRGNTDNWQLAQEAMLAAVMDFDEALLDQIYESLLSRFSDARVTQELIIPLLYRLGESWRAGEIGVAEEHFFSIYIRNKLGSRWHHGQRSLAGRRLVVSCMPGDRHEYGLLFFALVARTRGFDPILLGADMPLNEIHKVVTKTRSAAVVLSCTIQPGWQVVERDLKTLATALAVPLFIGGAGTCDSEVALAAVGAIPVGTELVAGVETIYRKVAGEH